MFEAKVTNNKDNDAKFFLGLCETSFKEICKKYTKYLRNEVSNQETEPSKYIWLMKDSDETPTIKWRILKQVSAKPK